jgi:hypothetical protein
MIKQVIFYLIVGLIFQACSNKQYFEPEDTNSINTNIIEIPAYIKHINSVGATLEDRRFIDKNGISKKQLKKGFIFLNNINGNIISANKNYELYVNEIYFKFKSNVIAASLEEDLLALIFSNNTIAIYDMKKKTFRLKKYLEISYLNDIRIAMPMFFNDLIIFPSLDGKLILINKQTYKLEKIITIDTSAEVKNIILLNKLNDNIIVATSNVLASLSSKSLVKKTFFIQSYAINKHNVFIATLDGQIIKFDKNLNILQKKKYKFAKIQSLSVSNKSLFAIESQGYIIKSKLDLSNEKIDKISFENDEKTFSSEGKIYYEDKLLSF